MISVCRGHSEDGNPDPDILKCSKCGARHGALSRCREAIKHAYERLKISGPVAIREASDRDSRKKASSSSASTSAAASASSSSSLSASSMSPLSSAAGSSNAAPSAASLVSGVNVAVATDATVAGACDSSSVAAPSSPLSSSSAPAPAPVWTPQNGTEVLDSYMWQGLPALRADSAIHLDHTARVEDVEEFAISLACLDMACNMHNPIHMSSCWKRVKKADLCRYRFPRSGVMKTVVNASMCFFVFFFLFFFVCCCFVCV